MYLCERMETVWEDAWRASIEEVAWLPPEYRSNTLNILHTCDPSFIILYISGIRITSPRCTCKFYDCT